MSEFQSLQNRFLIAMPSMADSYFDHSVTYVCEHNEHGALGIVINRPMELTITDMLDQLELGVDDTHTDIALGQHPLLTGGPVQPERGFVLHAMEAGMDEDFWDASMPVTDHIALTGSTDVLSAIAAGRGPSQFLVALGYAGWSAGQLEQELIDNAWLVTSASRDILFKLPYEQRWTAAAGSLGIDPGMLSSEVGHA